MTSEAYVQLIEPDGTPNIMALLSEAIKWCKENPGWSWRYPEL